MSRAPNRKAVQAGALSSILREHSQIVVFTGAGISTESGISDYRSKGGIWERFMPVTYQEFLADEEKRLEYWARKKELMESLAHAGPNAGHIAIADLEKTGRLTGVITQNIDGLHQAAGNSAEKVLELHGTNRTVSCLECGDRLAYTDVVRRLADGEEVPRCRICRGLLKPDTISFGQSLDPDILAKSAEWTRQCTLFLAVGSTLVVEPAASLPLLAKRQGAKLVLINLSATPLDNLADLLIDAPSGQTLQSALRELKTDKI